MMNKMIIGILAVVIVLGAVYYFQPGSQTGADQEAAIGTSPTAETGTSQDTAKSYEILITDKSFSPLRLEVKSGDKVVFKNTDTKTHWPASVPAPLTGRYPGYDPSKCGTVDEVNNFDACRALAPGETYSFVFKEIGSWGYWDKQTPSWTGLIEVK